MAISIGSNIPSLQAQRRLRTGTSTLEKIFERVASGLRINRASDDAAGLAIATSLNADRRIYSAALRNVNDGISALNIAEGGLQQLSGIVTRIAELAQQSANGVYSSAQRSALDSEARALRSEYERISETTSFNGLSLLDGRVNVGLQVDKNTYLQDGSNAGQLDITLGSSAATAVGDGTFDALGSISQATSRISSADFNGDGYNDLVSGIFGAVEVRLNDGSGNFGAPDASVGGPGATFSHKILTSDLDNDGDTDAVVDGDEGAQVFLNDGTGNLIFNAAYGTDGPAAVGDLNNDGFDDIVYADQNGTGDVSVYLNDQDGTFSLHTTFAESAAPSPVDLIDLNFDGNLDLITNDNSSGNFSVRLGAGTGSFGGQTTYSSGTGGMNIDFGDINGDGNIDMIGTSSFVFGSFSRLGRSDGTFEALNAVSSLMNVSSTFELRDLNGDGVDDVATVHGSALKMFINDGQGSFTLAESLAVAGNGLERAAFADFDGDGVDDVAVSDGGSEIDLYRANSSYQGVLENFSLLSKATALAALDQMRNQLPRLTSELGNIGSMQSRLEATVRNLSGRSEAVAAAQARIEDADIAVESADLVRTQILQRAAASVLGQANQLPALAIQLLGG